MSNLNSGESNSRYKLNNVLWIEDQPEYLTGLLGCFGINNSIAAEFGLEMKHIISNVKHEVSPEKAMLEVERLVSIAGDKPYILLFQTAQTARTYLEQYLPAAIISDSNFPLNGKAVVGWLKAHGLSDYPLIGYSGKDLNELDLEVQDFFSQTFARYFVKLKSNSKDIIDGVLFSRRYVELLKNREGGL